VPFLNFERVEGVRPVQPGKEADMWGQKMAVGAFLCLGIFMCGESIMFGKRLESAYPIGWSDWLSSVPLDPLSSVPDATTSPARRVGDLRGARR
jgi:hypothetical protein